MSNGPAAPVQSHAQAGLRLTIDRDHAGAVKIELRRTKPIGPRSPLLPAIFATAAVLLAIVVVYSPKHRTLAHLVTWHEPLQDHGLSATLLIVSMLLLLLAFAGSGTIVGEQILVIRDLGLQHGLMRSNPFLMFFASVFNLSDDFGIATRSHLIPRDEIMDVVVHEAFSRWTIRTYIAVLLTRCDERRFSFTPSPQTSVSAAPPSQFMLQPGGQGGVIVLFPHLRPRLKLVQIAYTEIHRTLF
ncbi:hypothetical protein OC845_004043 [Tilletia horrida]|nr:hypothetical protein OC845_004043 [Tilletia horrida]